MENIYKNTDLVYNFKRVQEVFSSNSKVEFDHVINIMNDVFNGQVSHNVEETNTDQYKLTVYTPAKIACMFFKAHSVKEINENIDKCFIDIVKKYFAGISDKQNMDAQTSMNQEDKQNTDGIALTTLDDIDKAEKEMMNVNNKNNDVITQEQIDFINNFKEEFKIDTDEKFNKYLESWNMVAHTNVHNKVQLAQAGYQVVQSFIIWVKDTKENETKETAFVTPSSDNTGILW